MTQRESKTSTAGLLLPPISLEFQILQEQRAYCDINVYGRSGNYCFAHRQVRAFYDHFGEIPVIVSSSLLKWTLWLVQLEAQRREADPQQRRQLHLQFPDWPSPEVPHIPADAVEF